MNVRVVAKREKTEMKGGTTLSCKKTRVSDLLFSFGGFPAARRGRGDEGSRA